MQSHEDHGLVSLPVGDTGLRACLSVTANRIESIDLDWATGEMRPANQPALPGGIEEIATAIRRWPQSCGIAVDWTSHPLFAARGTAFQRAVWRELCEIAAGETCTYGQLAERVGRPRAARAIGQAVGGNPWALLVPCHRVVAAHGRLGGYAHGTAIKSRLLAHEGLGAAGSETD
ncbi:MGMT family protein [Guyparkeria sp. 1SP6A2]|nr:MGMT family protein [Guyparkeria sp. 1SP6A2]